MTLVHFHHIFFSLHMLFGSVMEQHIGYAAIHLSLALSSCFHASKFQLAAMAVFTSQRLAKP